MQKVILVDSDVDVHEQLVQKLSKLYQYHYFNSHKHFLTQAPNLELTSEDTVIFDFIERNHPSIDFLSEVIRANPIGKNILFSHMVSGPTPEEVYLMGLSFAVDKSQGMMQLLPLLGRSTYLSSKLESDGLYVPVEVVATWTTSPGDLMVDVGGKRVKVLNKDDPMEDNFIERFKGRDLKHFFLPLKQYPVPPGEFEWKVLISARSLIPGKKITFNIYLKVKGKVRPALLFPKETVLNAEQIKKIDKLTEQQFFVPIEDYQSYLDYLEQSLAEGMQTPDLDTKKKAFLISDVGKQKLENVAYAPSKENIEEVQKLRPLLEQFINDDKNALKEMLQISKQSSVYQHCMNVAALAYGVIKECTKMSKMQRYANETDFYSNVIFTEELSKTILFTAGTLHDIGKAILCLNQFEPSPDMQEIFKLSSQKGLGKDYSDEHTIIGKNVLERYGEFSPKIAEIISYHEEFNDGSGHPHKKKGHQLSLYTQITAMVNFYDNLISVKKYLPEDAIVEMRKNRTKFNKFLLMALERVAGVES